MNDSELDELLLSANRRIPLPDFFRQKVWRRIESAALNEPKHWKWLDSLFSILARPVGAVAVVSALGVLGLWLGSTGMNNHGSSKLSYVESVSPFAAAHAR